MFLLFINVLLWTHLLGVGCSHFFNIILIINTFLFHIIIILYIYTIILYFNFFI